MMVTRVPDFTVPSSKSGGSAGPRAPSMRPFERRIADLGNLTLSWAS